MFLLNLGRTCICIFLPMRSYPYGESYSPATIYMCGREEIELSMMIGPPGGMSCHLRWLYVGQRIEGPRAHALYF